jgi:pyridoxamine 5'-phosphate oxidase family protein
MKKFSEKEIAYVREPRLGRLATVGRDGQPHVVPVGFRYSPETGTIDIGGHALDRTKKFRDVRAFGRAAFVVDDLKSADPWRPRGVLVRGEAEALESGGERIGPGFDGAWIRITPRRVISWGLDAS